MLSSHFLIKIFDLVVSGLSSEADILNELEADDQNAIEQQKSLLEMYAFLLQWSISVIEAKSTEKSATTVPSKGRVAVKNAKSKANARDGDFDSISQLEVALDTMCKVLRLKLNKIFMTTSGRDTFVGLFTRPVYLILENEQRIKITALRMHAFKVLCIAVKHHGHGFGEAFDACRVNHG